MPDRVELMQQVLDPLNRIQKNAVSSEAKHLRVLAGAGSGKTRVIVHRIAWFLVSGQASSANILAVTFTNKAANEMRSRIEQLISLPTSNFWVGTFHGIAHRILRRHHAVLALPDNFQIIDSDDQLRLVKRTIREIGLDEEVCEPKKAQSFINKQKDEGRRPQDTLPSPMPEIAMYNEVYRTYDNTCKRSGLLDFAEILLLSYELLRDNDAVRRDYQQQFSHILVDEFQDTNTIQYQWLKMLIGENSSITIVGDDDQSIYGWRGARIENIHRFSKDFKDTETVRLEQNYRSTQTILNAANKLIVNNESRLGKELWTEHNKGEPITLYGAFNEMDEAKFIVDRIQKWLASGGGLDDVAILYRSNAQSRVLEQVLRQSQVPYKIYGGLRFFDRAEIKDVLAYMRLLVNTADDPAFERVVNVPPRGVGDRTIANLREFAKAQSCSLWEAAKQTLPTMNAGRIRNGLQQFVDTIEALIHQINILNFEKLTEQVFEQSGLMMHVKSQPGERTQIRVENLMEFLQAIRQYQRSCAETQSEANSHSAQTLPAFLSEVALDAGEKEGESGNEASVKLMTLHSAKGLEFPLVFMAGLEDGLFPHHRNADKQALLEEERRLCYVGMTRAMQKLYLTYAEKRAFAGTSGSSRPSRFINELPKELIESVNLNINISKPMTARGLPPAKKQTVVSDLPYALGQRVRHARFGEGVVVCGEGKGDAARIQIKFERAGPKWLALAYAKLEAVD